MNLFEKLKNTNTSIETRFYYLLGSVSAINTAIIASKNPHIIKIFSSISIASFIIYVVLDIGMYLVDKSYFSKKESDDFSTSVDKKVQNSKRKNRKRTLRYIRNIFMAPILVFFIIVVWIKIFHN